MITAQQAIAESTSIPANDCANNKSSKQSVEPERATTSIAKEGLPSTGAQVSVQPTNLKVIVSQSAKDFWAKKYQDLQEEKRKQLQTKVKESSHEQQGEKPAGTFVQVFKANVPTVTRAEQGQVISKQETQVEKRKTAQVTTGTVFQADVRTVIRTDKLQGALEQRPKEIQTEKAEPVVRMAGQNTTKGDGKKERAGRKASPRKIADKNHVKGQVSRIETAVKKESELATSGNANGRASDGANRSAPARYGEKQKSEGQDKVSTGEKTVSSPVRITAENNENTNELKASQNSLHLEPSKTEGETALDHQPEDARADARKPAAEGSSNDVPQEKNSNEVNKTEPVRFAWDFTEAQTVSLCGSFKEWKENVEMANKDGKFEVFMHLPPGKHLYKFIVDGEWCYDITAATEQDDIGNINNYVIVA